jgi:NADH-quinone oxidoreductase subunit M
VASVGVTLAAVYMIRVFQRTMHDRVGPKVESREIGGLEFAVIAPIALVVVALGFYPQAILDNTKASTAAQIRAAAHGGAVPVARKPAAAPVDPTGGAQAVPQGQDVPQGAGGAQQQLTPEQIRQLQQQLRQQQQQGGAGAPPGQVQP